MKNLNVPSALVAIGGIAGLVALVALKADATVVAGYATAIITIATQMDKVFGTK